MRCPYCGKKSDRVMDSRVSRNGSSVRRRRECLKCRRRFTTYEYVERIPLMVIKKDSRREPFDREKLMKGIVVACESGARMTDATIKHLLQDTEMTRGKLKSGFASLTPEWDTSRAPARQRGLTLSTHTSNLQSWWQDYDNDRAAYEERKKELTERVLSAAETALPGLRGAVRLILPGTPVTYQRFTHRKWGWVGGFPQTGLLNNISPRLAKNLWLVGDSIFPGQSTAAVALGGLRVANAALGELGIQKSFSVKPSYAVEGEK